LVEPPVEFESTTPALQVRCSTGLSYGGPIDQIIAELVDV
jgi:hypothetical protein